MFFLWKTYFYYASLCKRFVTRHGDLYADGNSEHANHLWFQRLLKFRRRRPSVFIITLPRENGSFPCSANVKNLSHSFGRPLTGKNRYELRLHRTFRLISSFNEISGKHRVTAIESDNRKGIHRAERIKHSFAWFLFLSMERILWLRLRRIKMKRTRQIWTRKYLYT